MIAAYEHPDAKADLAHMETRWLIRLGGFIAAVGLLLDRLLD